MGACSTRPGPTSSSPRQRSSGYSTGTSEKSSRSARIRTRNRRRPKYGTDAPRSAHAFQRHAGRHGDSSRQAVVEDQVDAPGNADLLLFTPARTKPLLNCCTYYTGSSVNLNDATRTEPTAARDIDRLLPTGFSPFATNPTAAIEAKAERAIKPESIALGVFGCIAALAVLLIAVQLIGRLLRLDAGDVATLRALGAGPGMAVGDELLGIVGAVVVGSVLAVCVAVGVSPLFPARPGAVRCSRTRGSRSTGRCSDSALRSLS